MRHALAALWIAASVVGCDSADPIPLQTQTDSAVIDAQMDVDATQTVDMMVEDAHVADDAETQDAVSADAEADAGPTYAACRTDQSAENPVDIPEPNQVTMAYGGYTTYLIWSDQLGVHQCRINPDGELSGDRVTVDTPQVTPSSVSSLRVSGTTWVAYGGDSEPIHIYQAHRPGETLVRLDSVERTLVGEPLLADAGDSILVIGRTVEDQLAWQLIPNDLSDNMAFVSDSSGLGMPDSAGSADGGIYLRFRAAGQCVFVRSIDWQPAGSVPCRTEEGELISDGQRTILWHIERLGDDFITLKSLYDPDGIVRLSRFETPELAAMQFYRGYKPVIGVRNSPNPASRAGHLQLYFAGTDGVWGSMETWSAGWPWGNARAIAFAESAGSVFEGRCEGEDQAPCSEDDECEEDALCGGPFALVADDGDESARTGILANFFTDRAPEIVQTPLRKLSFVNSGSLFGSEEACVAVPESCNGRDDDCDGYVDDGICCADEGENGEIAGFFRTSRAIEEAHLADTENRDEYILAYRQTDNEGRRYWHAMRFKYVYDDPSIPTRRVVRLAALHLADCNQAGSTCVPNDDSYTWLRYADEGAFFGAVGGVRAFIGKTPADHPNPGRWGIHWMHQTRNLKGDDIRPVLLPEACDEILAAEGLRRVDEGESLVVVCRDRIYRAYAKAVTENVGDVNYPDQEWLFNSEALGGLSNVQWATINRKLVNSTCGAQNCQRHDSGFDLLVAFRSSLGDLRLRKFEFITGSDAPPSVISLPDQFSLATDEDLIHPIYLHQQISGPPLRITDDNRIEALFKERDAEGEQFLIWREVLTAADPEKVKYSLLNGQLFVGDPVIDPETNEARYAHWVVNTLPTDGVYNLWATSPLMVQPDPVTFWSAVQSNYSHDLVTVHPLNAVPNEWELRARRVNCLPPR